MPVKGSPVSKTSSPDWQRTSPWPAKSVSRQPVRDLPSSIGCQSAPSKGAEGWAAARDSNSLGESRGGRDETAAGAEAGATWAEGVCGAEVQPASKSTPLAKATFQSRKIVLAPCPEG